MHLVPETVYQALYGRGSLDLAVDPAVALRTERTGRRPRRRKEHRIRRFPNMDMIRDRPADAIGRLVPGHWEGDLIIGKGGRSAIGTLVERTTRFIVLVHLAGNRRAENLRDRLAEAMGPLPAHLRPVFDLRSGHRDDLPPGFHTANTHSFVLLRPGQPLATRIQREHQRRAGLLRQYFPKGTDLSVHTREHLAMVAAELNQRSRAILGWQSPLEHLSGLVSPSTEPLIVATTAELRRRHNGSLFDRHRHIMSGGLTFCRHI